MATASPAGLGLDRAAGELPDGERGVGVGPREAGRAAELAQQQPRPRRLRVAAGDGVERHRVRAAEQRGARGAAGRRERGGVVGARGAHRRRQARAHCSVRAGRLLAEPGAQRAAVGARGAAGVPRRLRGRPEDQLGLGRERLTPDLLGRPPRRRRLLRRGGGGRRRDGEQEDDEQRAHGEFGIRSRA